MSQPESTERCADCGRPRSLSMQGCNAYNDPDGTDCMRLCIERLRRALAEAETLKRISDSQAHEAWIERDGALARLAEAEKERVTTVKALHVACKAGRASEEALRAAEERAAQAERLFWMYGQHSATCRQSPGGNGPCTCAFAEAWAALHASRAEPRAAASEALDSKALNTETGAQGEEK